MMTYENAIEYLNSTASRGSQPGLSRVTALLGLLGNPQNSVKCVHVTGTNGKGSVSRMTASVLNAEGYKTGLFSSPYLTRVNESIMLGDEEISDSDFAEIMDKVKPLAEGLKNPPTEFEITTAVAFEFFRRKECDVVVLECGMGGLLDSTNIIENPLVSVITNVAKDHASFLGDTISEIASHKAGIIKMNCPVVWGGNDKEAERIIEKRASELKSQLYTVDFNSLKNVNCDISGSVFDFGDYKKLKISALGEYQPRNAAVAITAVEIIKKGGLHIDKSSVYKGLEDFFLHARFEQICDNPPVFFDGSHNPHGVESVVESIKNYFGGKKAVLLMGVMADKDYPEMTRQLSSVADRVFTVTPSNPRALDSLRLAMEFEKNKIHAESFENIEFGREAAENYAEIQNIPLVMLGSLYMYKDVTAVKNQ